MKTDNEQPADLAAYFERKEIFEHFLRTNDILLFCCPCCGYATLEEKSSYEICDICGWEDEELHEIYPYQKIGGPNGLVSLHSARLEFEAQLKKYEEETKRIRIEDPTIIYEIIKKGKADFNETYGEHKSFEEIEEMLNIQTNKNMSENNENSIFDLLTNERSQDNII